MTLQQTIKELERLAPMALQSICFNNFISLNKSQTPWDQDALPSYYVLHGVPLCLQTHSRSSRFLFESTQCFDSGIERACENAWIVFLWSHNQLRMSWRKDAVVMFTITHLRLFVQWFWERMALVNQVSWTFLLRSMIADSVSSSILREAVYFGANSWL